MNKQIRKLTALRDYMLDFNKKLGVQLEEQMETTEVLRLFNEKLDASDDESDAEVDDDVIFMCELSPAEAAEAAEAAELAADAADAELALKRKHDGYEELIIGNYKFRYLPYQPKKKVCKA